MNLRFVEAFYWAVTLKSITRAAEKLHVTQSAMSSRIAALEDAMPSLKPDRIAGVGGLATRHDSMAAGEAGGVERADGEWHARGCA